ncbi:RNase adapter RapZ [Geminicoccaceae bacterium 1502E]|nr:RNase adapter RapZ [Geminicoccaceae bacterium 1502E]
MSSIVIVTGMSGAGRTSCLKALEDAGYEAVDNLPFQLLLRLLDSGTEPERPLAIGIDSRTRGLGPEELVTALARWREAGHAITLLFFECDDETLQRRFTETRRRHPMAPDRRVSDGIDRERLFLAPVKAAADLLYDSSETSLADLRRWIAGQFGTTEGGPLSVTVESFAFRNGLPREADLVFDMRFLRNPHYVDALRPHTGLDDDVQEYIRGDQDYAGTMERLEGLILPLLPRYQAEGKSYLTIAIGCTGGKHRSVFVTEQLGLRLRRQGWNATTVHRDMPRGGSSG